MSYIETIGSQRSKIILTKGDSVWYSWYDYPNGAKWVARYRGRYFHITHDGTGNEFFCSHAPREISEKEAKRILWDAGKYEEGMKTFGWEPLSDDEEAQFVLE